MAWNILDLFSLTFALYLLEIPTVLQATAQVPPFPGGSVLVPAPRPRRFPRQPVTLSGLRTPCLSMSLFHACTLPTERQARWVTGPLSRCGSLHEENPCAR